MNYFLLLFLIWLVTNDFLYIIVDKKGIKMENSSEKIENTFKSDLQEIKEELKRINTLISNCKKDK